MVALKFVSLLIFNSCPCRYGSLLDDLYVLKCWCSTFKKLINPTCSKQSRIDRIEFSYRLPQRQFCKRVLSERMVLIKAFIQKLSCCSGSLEPESSCHDRDWIMELPMEADILTFTGILTPEDASVASCFPFDITISLSWFPLLSIHYTPLYHRGRETSSCPGRHFSNPESTNVSWRLPNLYPESYDWGLPDHRLVDWPHGLTSLDRPRGLAGGHRPGHELLPRINKQKRLNMRRNRTWWNDKTLQ